MSVIIKDFNMPSCCNECDLCDCFVLDDGTEENYRCALTMYPVYNFDKLHEKCPLVPIPEEHGRIIDELDIDYVMFEKKMADELEGVFITTFDKVYEAQTILEEELEI